MLINEIEVEGTSIALKCLCMKTDDINTVYNEIMEKGDVFSLDTELPGFHDVDFQDSIIRGFFSVVYPFEIEHLVDGLTTKTLFKRIESCEFIITEKIIWAWGKNNPIKLLNLALGAATGENADLAEFEFSQMSLLQERMLVCKAIVLANPKEKEIRRARLTGHMENYTEYNIIDPRNHSIESVSGLLETPLGKLTVTVSKKGSIRLGVKKGMILTVECLEYILDSIISENGPEPIKDAAPF